MFSPFSNISEADTEILEQQYKEIWQWHKEEQ